MIRPGDADSGMRVLFTTQPGHGHLNPWLPVAQALTAAGHEVAGACAASFRPHLEARGVQAFAMGLDWSIGDASLRQRWEMFRVSPDDDFLTFVMAGTFAGDLAEQALPDLLEIARDWQPDIIVHETCEFGGWLAAQILGIPHVSVEVTLFAFYVQYLSPMSGSLVKLLERADLPSDNVPARLFEHLHLSLVPPSFEDPAAPLPATARALRAPTLAALPDEQLPPLLSSQSDRPTVYVTGGTGLVRLDHFQATISGLQELDANLIVTSGRIEPAEFGSQPGNVYIAPYLSQSLILPHAAVVVTHGGFSSVLGALAHGVPLVILPRGADHSVNARRAEALGTAIVLGNAERTPERIRGAVREVLDQPRFRERARQIQAENDSLPGPECAVALLERLV
jgi:UDP:flavonoid glycosyltransferase YjiC (YdhE family)